jgi:hypothetical protein
MPSYVLPFRLSGFGSFLVSPGGGTDGPSLLVTKRAKLRGGERALCAATTVNEYVIRLRDGAPLLYFQYL